MFLKVEANLIAAVLLNNAEDLTNKGSMFMPYKPYALESYLESFGRNLSSKDQKLS